MLLKTNLKIILCFLLLASDFRAFAAVDDIIEEVSISQNMNPKHVLKDWCAKSFNDDDWEKEKHNISDLIKKFNIDVNSVVDQNQLLLYRYTDQGEKKLKLLISHGLDLNKVSVIQGVESLSTELFDDLLAKGDQVRLMLARTLLRASTQSPETAKISLSHLEKLFRGGVDPNDLIENKSLQLGIRHFEEKLKLLISHGLDLNKVSVIQGVESLSTELFDDLLAKGDQVRLMLARTLLKAPAWSPETKNTNLSHLEKLFRGGVDPNDLIENKSLQLGIRHFEEKLKLLISHGLDLNKISLIHEVESLSTELFDELSSKGKQVRLMLARTLLKAPAWSPETKNTNLSHLEKLFLGGVDPNDLIEYKSLALPNNDPERILKLLIKHGLDLNKISEMNLIDSLSDEFFDDLLHISDDVHHLLLRSLLCSSSNPQTNTRIQKLLDIGINFDNHKKCKIESSTLRSLYKNDRDYKNFPNLFCHFYGQTKYYEYNAEHFNWALEGGNLPWSNSLSNINTKAISSPKVPRIIHSIWLTNSEQKREMCEGDIANIIKTKDTIFSNKKHLGKWQHVVWTNDKSLIPNTVKKLESSGINVREISEVANHLKLVDEVNELIKQAKWGMASDALRYDLVYYLGGVYVDADFEFFKDLENEIHKFDFLTFNGDGNSFFLAKPRHPILLDVLYLVKKNLKNLPDFIAQSDKEGNKWITYLATVVPFHVAYSKVANTQGTIDIRYPHPFTLGYVRHRGKAYQSSGSIEGSGFNLTKPFDFGDPDIRFTEYYNSYIGSALLKHKNITSEEGDGAALSMIQAFSLGVDHPSHSNNESTWSN
jgi:hypothetical protein